MCIFEPLKIEVIKMSNAIKYYDKIPYRKFIVINNGDIVSLNEDGFYQREHSPYTASCPTWGTYIRAGHTLYLKGEEPNYYA